MMLNKTVFFSLATILAQNAFASQLVAYDCQSCAALERAEVHYSWPIKDRPITKIQKAPKRESLSYLVKVNSKQLQQGYKLPIHGTEAVLKLTALSKTQQSQMNVKALTLLAPNQKMFALSDAAQKMADAKSLKATPYYAGENMAFQLSPEVGKGMFQLIAADEQQLPANDSYLVSVYDKNSPIALSLQADKMVYAYGETVRVDFALSDGHNKYSLDDISANLVLPNGDKQTMMVSEEGNGSYVASIKLSQLDNARGEALYVTIDVTGDVDGDEVKRRGQTAFAYVIPSAKISPAMLKHASMTKSNDTDLSLEFDIEAMNASRYEVEGTLYGTGDDGKLHPMMQAQTANWFEAGRHQLVLYFDKTVVAASAYHAPYAVKNIRLIDQAQLAPIGQMGDVRID